MSRPMPETCCCCSHGHLSNLGELGQLGKRNMCTFSLFVLLYLRSQLKKGVQLSFWLGQKGSRRSFRPGEYRSSKAQGSYEGFPGYGGHGRHDRHDHL